METIHVNLAQRAYDVRIGRGLLDRVGEEIEALAGRRSILVVTDDNVGPLYLERVMKSLTRAGHRAASLTLPHGEGTKSMGTLPRVYAALAAHGVTRTDLALALGGGVIGDLSGFAAATWLRGVRFVQVPTSLLAQVDASVGGKVAVDLPQGKNLVGAFWQPSLVLIDPDTLESLPTRYWLDGLGEVVKTGCILDEGLFALLEQLAPLGREGLTVQIEEILRRCVQAKASVVAEDERDTGRRMLLNFGHTLGHAIETCEGYQGHSHGEAVAIGMAAVARIQEAEHPETIARGTSARLDALLDSLGLPRALPSIPADDLLRAMGLDKKKAGDNLRIVLLRRIGEAFILDSSPAFFQRDLTASNVSSRSEP